MTGMIPDRRTNLDGIRLLAAFGVLLGHAFELHRLGTTFVLGVPLGSLCVMVFFVISGWLVTASWDRSPDVSAYLRNRCLRLLPALCVVVVITAFVVGPLFTTVSRPSYFSDPETWKYLLNISLVTQHHLPGVFTSNPFPFSVNGSLWTLPIEFCCYLVVPMLCLGGPETRVAVAVAASVVSIIGFFRASSSLIVLAAPLSQWLLFCAFFTAGAALRSLAVAVRSERWLRIDIAAFLITGESFALALQPMWGVALNWVVLPYAVMALSLTSTPVVKHASRFGDFSYGLYLWAFPVQQVIIAWDVRISMWQYVGAATAVAGVLAIGSWFVIERPALALKRTRVRGAHRMTPAVVRGSSVARPRPPVPAESGAAPVP